MNTGVTALRGFALGCVSLVMIGGLVADPALAQGQRKGEGSIRIAYQFIRTGDFPDDVGKYDYWTTDSHVVLFSGDYALSDRHTLFVSLPYVQKRFNPGALFGGDPHNPNDPYWIDFVPPDKRFLDDGEYHGDFQDLSIGISYLALDGPLTISPYISYGVPTNDYPFFAKAAVGLNLWSLPIGASFRYIPHFSDWYLSGNVAYVFSERPLDINVDYWLVHLSAGYWFKPQFSMNAFMGLKSVRGGLKLPWDFTDDPLYGNYPDDFDTEQWWQHDRLLGHRNLNVGIGFDYFVNKKYSLSGSGFTGLWAEQSNEVDFAFTLALSRHFGPD